MVEIENKKVNLPSMQHITISSPFKDKICTINSMYALNAVYAVYAPCAVYALYDLYAQYAQYA